MSSCTCTWKKKSLCACKGVALFLLMLLLSLLFLGVPSLNLALFAKVQFFLCARPQVFERSLFLFSSMFGIELASIFQVA